MGFFFLLSAVGIFLYWQTINTLHKADYQFLDDEVENVQVLLNAGDKYKTALKQAVIHDPIRSENSIYRYFIRVVDDKSTIIIETPGMHDIFTNNQSTYSGYKKYLWYSKNGISYLLIQKLVHLDSKKMGYIQILLDVSFQHSFINDRKNIFLLLLMAALSSVALGFMIANRGLRSLRVLAQTTENITITSLDQRIDPASWPMELRGVAHAFNKMLTRIQSSFERLHQLSGDLAHELRAPITNLIGESEMALSKSLTIPDYQDVLESHLEECRHLSQLIDNMLFLARAEHPQSVLETKPLVVNDEINNMLDYFQALTDEKHIAMFCDGAAILNANSIMFRRVINNVLSNAIKYTPNGGSISISIQEYNQKVGITITDTGIGIASEHLPRLFDRFYRVQPARDKQTGGHGLGLAIVKSIVNLHKGSIDIASEVNKGTCVTLIFPK